MAAQEMYIGTLGRFSKNDPLQPLTKQLEPFVGPLNTVYMRFLAVTTEFSSNYPADWIHRSF